MTATANLVFSRPTGATAATTPAGSWGPFSPLDVGYYPLDADGVALQGFRLNLNADTTVGYSTLPTNGLNDCNNTTLCERMKIGGGVNMKLGRLLLLNSYGSELLNPRVEARAQYFSPSGRWITHSEDNFTALVPGNLFTSNPLGALGTPLSLASVTSPLVNGISYLTFSKATPAKTGSFDIALNLSSSGSDTSCNASHGGTPANLAWLKDYGYINCASGAASWSRDPNARVRLGSPKAPFIYLRERY